MAENTENNRPAGLESNISNFFGGYLSHSTEGPFNYVPDFSNPTLPETPQAFRARERLLNGQLKQDSPEMKSRLPETTDEIAWRLLDF